MITENEYLTLYSRMNATEQKEYLDRVEKWNEETFPRLITLAECWEQVPVKDFDEGLKLASALSKARGFIPEVMRYEAERALRKIRSYLEEIRQKTGLSKINTRSQYDTTKYRAVIPPMTAPDTEEEQSAGTRSVRPQLASVDGYTVEHLSDYYKDLPTELQKRADKIKERYLTVSQFRGKIDFLVEKDEIEFKDDISKLAKQVVEEETMIRAFWSDVDNFRQNGKMVDNPIEDMRRPGDYTKEEIDAMSDLAMQEKCRKARVECDKKYIRRNGTKITDEYRKQLQIRIIELMEWNETIPEKGKENCKKAGVVIDGYNNVEE